MDNGEETLNPRLSLGKSVFSVETMEDILSAHLKEAYLNVSEASCFKIFSNFHRYLGQKGSLFPLVTIIEYK